MVEILAKFKIKIDWNNYKQWDNYNDSNFQFTENQNKITTLFFNGWSTQYIRKDILKKYTHYKVKLKINKYFNIDATGGLIIKVGDNEQIYSDISALDEIEFTINSGNGSYFSLKPYTLTDKFGVNNIIIEQIDNENLDVYEDTLIPLTFDIANVTDLENRKGVYSKSFKLPGTKKNNEFFKYIFKINNDNLFNVNAKLQCVIIDPNLKEKIKEGFLKLTKINKKNINQVEYEVLFFDSVIDLFTEFGDDVIADLNWQDLNHYATYDNIINSWTNYQTLGYVYPYIDYGRGELAGVVGYANDDRGKGLIVDDLHPAVTASKVIEKIEEKYGVEFESSFFDSALFKKIIIPFQNKEEDIAEWTTVARIESSNQGNRYNLSSSYVPSNLNIDENTGKYNDIEILTSQNGIPHSDYWIDGNSQTAYYIFDTIINNYLSLNNNSSQPGGTTDVVNQSYINYFSDFNNNLTKYPQFEEVMPGMFLVKKPGKYKIKIKYKIDTFVQQVGVTNEFVKLFVTKINQSGIEYPVNDQHNIENNTFKVYDEYTQLIWWHTSTCGYTEKTINIDADIGDMIGVKFITNTGFNGDIESIEWLYYGYTNGTPLKGNKFAPKKYKLKDFVKDLAIISNSIVDSDKNNPNKIIFENRYNYLSNYGSTKDWTYKYDNSQTLEINKESNLSKTTVLKFSEADDRLNKDYNENRDVYKVGYGGTKFNFDNDFKKDKKTITPTLKPTVLRNSLNIKGDNDEYCFVYSSINHNEIDEYEEKTEIGNRLLYFNLLDIYDNSSADVSFRFEGAVYHSFSTKKYPYAGHFTNPFDLTNCYDLNFKTPVADWFSNTWQFPIVPHPAYTTTNLNMYNLYWKKYLMNLSDKDTALVTAYLNLNDIDIKDFSFADKIFINGAYYRVNKISDYIVGVAGLYKVELLKLTEGNITYSDYDDYNSGDVNIKPIGIKDSKKEDSKKDGNVELGDGSLVIKDKNTTVNSDNSTPNKNSDSTVINSKNNVFSDSTTKNVLINTENTEVKQSGSTYISGVLIKNGMIIEYNGGLNDSGEDTVQEAFSNAFLIDSGENQIYLPDYINSDIVMDGGED